MSLLKIKLMRRLLGLSLVIVLLHGCTQRIITTSTADYSEDVSEFRPTVEAEESSDYAEPVSYEKGPYVAPTNDINEEMAALMDSIKVNNLEKTHLSYTVQVYLGRNREEANKVREKVYRLMPDEKPELDWNPPSYKVLVGNYYDRVEAYKTYTELRQVFPSANLVPRRNKIEESN